MPKLLRFLCLLTLHSAMGALPAAADPLPVFVSIQAQHYVVQQIRGDHGAIRVMAAPGDSPATDEPKTRQMAPLAGAALR